MQMALKLGPRRAERSSYGRLAVGCVIMAMALLLSGMTLLAETSAQPKPAVDARVEVLVEELRVGEEATGRISFWLPPAVDVGTAEELSARVAEAQGWAVESLLVDSGEYGTWVELSVDGFLPGAGRSRRFQLDVTSIAALLNRYGVSSFELAVGAEKPCRLHLSSGPEWLAGTKTSQFFDGWYSWISMDLSASKAGRGDLHGRGAGEGAQARATGVLEFEVRFPASPAIWRLLVIAAAVVAAQALVRAVCLRVIERAPREGASGVLWQARRFAWNVQSAGILAILFLTLATDAPNVFLNVLGVASARAKLILPMLILIIPAESVRIFCTIAMYDALAQVRGVRANKLDAFVRILARLVISDLPLYVLVVLFLIVPEAALKAVCGNWAYAVLAAAGISAMPIAFEPVRVLAWPCWGLAPVEDEKVMGVVRELSDKAGIEIKGAYVAKTGRFRVANAGVMTFARRIVLSDHLLDVVPIGELKCVIARELAHIKLAWRFHLADAIDLLLKSAAFAGLCVGLGVVVFRRGLPPEAAALVVALPVLAAVESAMNRFRRVTELRADRSVVELTGDRESCFKAHFRLALLDMVPLGGRGWVRYRVTYPSMWKWIEDTAANIGIDEVRLAELVREVEAELAL